MTQTIKVKSLHMHPVKSCGGIALDRVQIGPMGINHDRQWMVVNEHGIFCAQRGDAQLGATGIRTMCLIKARYGVSGFVLSAPGMPDLILPFGGLIGKERVVRVWRSTCSAIDQGDEAAEWFTEYLSREVPGIYRLVRMPNYGTRKTEIGNAGVGFADGYPFLTTSQASLDALNATANAAIPMDRFRPNIVLEGCDPFFEDSLLGRKFMIGDVLFTGVKPCVRCPITTINQDTAEQGKFPLNMLAKHHEKFHGPLLAQMGTSAPKGAIFGMNLNHLNLGTVSKGDVLKVL